MSDMVRYPALPGRTSRAKAPIRLTRGDNASRQRAAVKRMSECEVLCGFTAEELAAFHAEQKARVLSRFGVAA